METKKVTYQYFLLGDSVPVRVAFNDEGMKVGAEVPDRNKGVLVTYAAKGSVRRAMQAVGFVVERLPGPPGKREMLRATKDTHRDQVSE